MKRGLEANLQDLNARVHAGASVHFEGGWAVSPARHRCARAQDCRAAGGDLTPVYEAEFLGFSCSPSLDALAYGLGKRRISCVALLPRLDATPGSTGGKPRLGRITKMGDRYLPKLLVVGACATLRHRKAKMMLRVCGRADARPL